MFAASKQRNMFQTASIAGGATIAVFLVVIVCVAVYIHLQRKQKETRARYISFQYYQYNNDDIVM
jgi:keren protein